MMDEILDAVFAPTLAEEIGIIGSGLPVLQAPLEQPDDPRTLIYDEIDGSLWWDMEGSGGAGAIRLAVIVGTTPADGELL